MNACRACLALLLAAGLAVPADAWPPPAAPRLDRHGDPLPAGALARFGSLRFQQAGPVWAVAYSPDGKLLASVGQGMSGPTGVVLWDAVTGKELRRLRGATTGYACVRFLRGGKEVVAGFEDGLDRWDTATGKHLGGSIDGHGSYLAVSQDEKTLVTAGRQHLQIRDPASLRVLRRINAWENYRPGSPPLALALSPDGKLLAAPPGGELKLWEVVSGEPVPTPVKHRSRVTALAFSPDGRSLATGTADGAARLWDLRTGKELSRMPGHQGDVRALAFAPGGRVLAVCADGAVRLWNAAEGTELARCVGGRYSALALAFSPNGKTLVSGGWYPRLVLWETATGKERAPRDGHLAGARVAAFLPDGRTVVSAGLQEIRLWRARTGEGLALLTTVPHVSGAVALRADGGVAAVHLQGGKVAFWDVPGRKLTRELKGLPHGAALIATGPGELLALTGDQHLRVLGAAGRVLWTAREAGPFYEVVFSSGGRWVTAVSSNPPAGKDGRSCHRVGLWDARTGKRAQSWEMNLDALAARLALSPDGSLLAVAPEPARGGRGDLGGAAVYGTAGGTLLRSLRDPGQITGLAFSPDGRSLATGASNGTVHLWEVASGQLRRRFVGHVGMVSTLAFSSDGRLLVSGCSIGDPTLLVWDLTARPEGGREDR
jgi:WD40 repeat protein